MSEIFEADIFEEVGLTSVSIEEKVEFVKEFGRLLGMTGLLKAGDNLSEKDQDTLLRLLGEQEEERIQAFLTSRNVDLEEIIAIEAIKIREAVVTSGVEFSSVDELLMAIKAELPPSTHEIEFSNVMNLVHELKADLPGTEEQKERLVETVVNAVSYNVQMEVEEMLEPGVLAQVTELMDGNDTGGEGILLMLKHQVDYVRLSIEEVHRQFEKLKAEIKILMDSIG